MGREKGTSQERRGEERPAPTQTSSFVLIHFSLGRKNRVFAPLILLLLLALGREKKTPPLLPRFPALAAFLLVPVWEIKGWGEI